LGDRRIAYRSVGVGSRTFVFVHGLLMDSRMFAKLAPVVAAAGYRVLLVDMLGHGASGQPRDMQSYSMTRFGADVIALLEHLGIDDAVVGGTSLGANVALEAAVLAPKRIRGLVIEMPVLENAIAFAGVLFVPLALAIRLSLGGMRVLSAVTRKIPRSLFVVDIGLDFVRRDPAASVAVLDGITFGRIAPPPAERRRLEHRTLVIGHGRDPIHPFSDADMLANELPNARLVEARSIFEWRVTPRRLNRELISFLDGLWALRGRAAA